MLGVVIKIDSHNVCVEIPLAEVGRKFKRARPLPPSAKIWVRPGDCYPSNSPAPEFNRSSTYASSATSSSSTSTLSPHQAVQQLLSTMSSIDACDQDGRWRPAKILNRYAPASSNSLSSVITPLSAAVAQAFTVEVQYLDQQDPSNTSKGKTAQKEMLRFPEDVDRIRSVGSISGSCVNNAKSSEKEKRK